MGKTANNQQKTAQEETLISAEKIKILRQKVNAVKKDGKRVGIFVHDDGDPDAYAPAMAWKEYFESFEIEADIFAGGSTGHPMNTTMIKELKIDVRNKIPELVVLDNEKEKKEIDPLKDYLKQYGLTIMCDGMPYRTTVLKNLPVDIVIDHHTNPLVFNDDTLLIHEKVGASSTIVYFLMKILKFNLSEEVATALALGISADTKDFSRIIETTDWDKKAHKELRAIYDYALFEKINKWYDLTEVHLALIGEAYSKMEHIGDGIRFMGVTESSEGQTAYLAHIVDKAMRTGIKVAIIMAIESGNCIKVKVRENSTLIIENFCKEVFELNEYESDKNRASAGGRTGSGGAKIPFSPRERGIWKSIEKESDPKEKRKKKEEFFDLYFKYYLDKIADYVDRNGI